MEIISEGITLIRRERERQIEVEGFDAKKDSQYHHTHGLELAAACYLDNAVFVDESGDVPADWPWHVRWWKPTANDFGVRDLVKAGALIAAAIDRKLRHDESATDCDCGCTDDRYLSDAD